LLRGALGSILSPMGLLTVGVSAVTAGFLLYDKYAESSKKSTDDLNKTTKEYVDTLEAVRGAMLKGAQNSQQELVSLKALYGITQNTTLSLRERNRAVDELQQRYPAYFGNLKNEQVLNGNAKASYDTLTTSILASGRARAALAKITENASKDLENESKNIDLVNNLNQY